MATPAGRERKPPLWTVRTAAGRSAGRKAVVLADSVLNALRRVGPKLRERQYSKPLRETETKHWKGALT